MRTTGNIERVLPAGAVITTFRVIGALLLRETRVRFGRSQLGYLWAILEPVGGTVVLTMAFSAMGRPPVVGSSQLLFFALGMLSFNLYRRLEAQLGAAFEANAALMSFPIVQRFDTLIARALLELATSAVTLLIIIAALVLFEDVPLPARTDSVVFALGALSLLGFGLGTINAVLNDWYPAWRLIDGIIKRPLMLISGVLFVPEMLPSNVSSVLSWNPVFHGVEWVRYGYYEGYRPDFIDVNYLLTWGLVTTVLGLTAERFVPRHG